MDHIADQLDDIREMLEDARRQSEKQFAMGIVAGLVVNLVTGWIQNKIGFGGQPNDRC